MSRPKTFWTSSSVSCGMSPSAAWARIRPSSSPPPFGAAPVLIRLVALRVHPQLLLLLSQAMAICKLAFVFFQLGVGCQGWAARLTGGPAGPLTGRGHPLDLPP